MKVNRVLLVSSPLDDDEGRREAVNSRCFPPLGLLRIATQLHSEIPDVEIKVVDGDLIGLPAIRNLVESFQPDIVGVSVLTTTYKSALEIATHSKNYGVGHVVFGNDHASFFPETILRRNEAVSFIIVGDNGERDFVDLITAIRSELNPFETVSNLNAIVDGKLVSSSGISGRPKGTKPQKTNWADPQFLGDTIVKYQDAYASRFGKFHGAESVRAFLVNNAKGCYKANERCFYCSIYDLKIRTGNAESFWDLIRGYWKRYGFNFFFEVCDNFSGLKAYRRSLVESIPKWFEDSEIELMVYGDANMICRDSELLDDFERLHVRRVNMGIDSGDSEMLARLKGFPDAEVNKRAIAMLSERGIQIHSSFVLGGPGENETSLSNTLSLINEALTEPAVVAMEVSPLFPMPQAPVWDLFLGDFAKPESQLKFEQIATALGRERREFEPVWVETRAKFHGNDMIDLSLASQMWADHFTGLGHAPLQSIVSDLNLKIGEAGKITGGFG
jgi:anaerobic magnesium-protoporphyrin IX monomethyl ester cyclase